MIASHRRRTKKGFAIGLTVAGALLLLGSCSSPSDPLDPNNMTNHPTGDPCATPSQGCACSPEGATAECGEVIRKSGDFVTCSVGHRTCANGTWGACEGDRIAIHSVGPLSMGGIQTQGMPVPCMDDPCNPNCYTFDQDGGAVDAAGIQQTEAGITLIPQDGSACTGIACNIASCDGGMKTTITGTVTDPMGLRPINGAFVYVPNAPLSPFPSGVQNDPCGGGGTLSGNPIVVTQTKPDGTFTLTNVPFGSNIPLVIQVGMWRRQVTIPNVPACATTNANAAVGGWSNPCSTCTPVPPANYGALHLPRTKAEGDIPLIALVTGGCDMFECLMKRIGVSTTEFTTYTGTGRIHMYKGKCGYPLQGGSPFMDYLFQSQAQVDKYNIILLPCDCGCEYSASNYTQTFNVPYWQAQNEIVQYANKGGRVFTSHWGRNWIERKNNLNVSPFPGVANWYGSSGTCGQYGCSSSIQGWVDTSFPKGLAFSQWMAGPQVLISNPFWVNPTRIDVKSVNAPTERWVYGRSDNNGSSNPDAIINMAFNTPLGGMTKNGRVAYSDTHVSAQDYFWPAQFPTICNPSDNMTAQEKALEYMFFDLGACNTPINVPPYQNPVTFTLDYEGTCPNMQKVVWRFFDWKAITPLDSKIEFKAATASTQAGLSSATSVGIGTASVALNTASAMPPPPANWTGTDVSVQLATIPQKSQSWLRITITLYPSSNQQQAPTLSAWRQLFDCVDNL